MRASIHKEVIQRLVADYSLKEKGEYLRYGVCPNCNKKELFTSINSPWVIRCGRDNKCGWSCDIKTLYRDVFTQFNQRFIPTDSNPNATADAYMEMARGFDITRIKGWYRQGKFWHPKADKGTATVRFDIDRANDVYMERFIEEVSIEGKTRKAHFNNAHKGLWWQPPGMTINRKDTVWLVEGCLDAIALNLSGVKAVSILSCSNYPETQLEAYRHQDITLIWALDGDNAGQRSTKKWVQRSRADGGFHIQAAHIPQNNQKTDWNDLYQKNRLSSQHRQNYLYEGSLLIAPNALSKALLMWKHKSSNYFAFDFNQRLYWFVVDLKKLNEIMDNIRKDIEGFVDEQELKTLAIEQAGALREIADCLPTFLYYQANTVTDESWYYCRVDFPHGGPSIKNTFTAAQTTAAADFKKRLRHIAPGASFSGETKQLDWFVKRSIYNIKVVKTVDFIGYSKEHQTYIFNDRAIHNGQVIPLNNEDFFEIGPLSIKSLYQGLEMEIGKKEDYHQEWPQLVYQSFGAKALVAVAFWIGSLFAEQIRAKQKSYPFLEIVGEAGAGKTTLVEFLWKLLGRADEEGFDPSKASRAAPARKFSQVANLPVVLIEADREEDASKSKKFDWEELKTAYNGRIVRSRAVKSAGVETFEPVFRASIVISQNNAVDASDAILQRLIHLCFDSSHHNAESKAASDAMNLIPVSELSYFLELVVTQEKKIMEQFLKQQPRYEKKLLAQPEIKSVRIAKNHGQLMALVDCMASLLPLSQKQHQETLACIESLSVERQQAIAQDHPIVQQFWEAYEFINDYINCENGMAARLNHSRKPNEIAVNLNHFIRLATEYKQQIPLVADLKKYLKGSKVRKFHSIKPINSAVENKTIKCWVFNLPLKKEL